MGDDSQRDLISINQTEPSNLNATSVEPISEESTDSHAEHNQVAVLYSHLQSAERLNVCKQQTVFCDSFDKLLSLLEQDRVNTIWFDESVKQPEREYIEGWAKIFRPELRAQTLPNQKRIH